MKSAFKNKDSGFNIGLRIFCVFMVCNIFSILYYVIMAALHLKYFYNASSQFVEEFLLFIVPLVTWKFVEKKSLSKMGFTKGKEARHDFLFGLLLGSLSISIVFFILLFTGSISISKSLLYPNFTKSTFTNLILFIMVGFAEETFFRGYCMGSIMPSKNKYAIIIVPSVLFSFAHIFNPNTSPLFFINVVLIGFLFTYMFFKSSNIWLPIGFHAMWDYFEGVVWGLPDSGIPQYGIYHSIIKNNNILNGGLTGPEGGIVVTLITLIGFIIIHIVYKENKSYI